MRISTMEVVTWYDSPKTIRPSGSGAVCWPHRDRFPEPLVFPVRRGFIFHGKGVVMHILEQSENTVIGKVARGSSAKRASALMNYGNLIAILVPFPLLIFWFGASMLVYAMNRHHPNPKVGHYTQQAAYRFYGVTGFFIVIATFIPGSGWIWYYGSVRTRLCKQHHSLHRPAPTARFWASNCPSCVWLTIRPSWL